MQIKIKRLAMQVAGAVVALGLGVSVSQASPTIYTINSYTGNTSSLTISVEQTGAKELTFDLSQASDTRSATVGELRAFYFSVADASFLAGADVTGSDVTSGTYSFNGVTKVAGENDTKINGGICGGSGCVFDVGVEIGTTGLDSPAITSTSFVYTSTNNLSLGTFFASTGDIFGARMKSFTSGAGSSKLACQSSTACPGSSSSSGGGGGNEVPEPASLALLGAGLLALGAVRRRRSIR